MPELYTFYFEFRCACLTYYFYLVNCHRDFNLGPEPHQLADHIGWGPGAAEVAIRLSVKLDTPLILSGYSRLVIDCNRPLQSGESIPEQSAGEPIPGNVGLTQEAREVRIDALFKPYHQAIDRLLDNRIHRPSVLISIHSYTPILYGRQRPWQIGVSYWRDTRLARLLFLSLTQGGDLALGDNEPYPLEENTDYTIPVQGKARGLPSTMIAIRQDGIHTEEG